MTNETESDRQMRSVLEEVLAPAREAQERAIAEHEILRDSRAFKNAIAYNRRICTSFIHLLHLANIMVSRSQALSEHTLSIRMTDYFLQSAVVVTYLIENGFHGPAKRELRFLLEAGIKFLVTDQRWSAATIEAKNKHIAELPDRFREIVDTLSLPGLDQTTQSEMRRRILDLYGSLSTIVHASQAQVAMDLKRWEHGAPIGFETVSHANTMNQLCLDVFDIGVVLSLHSVGLSLAGDIFTAVLDEQPKWVFHKSRFSAALSRYFDYKVERKGGAGTE